MEEVGELHVDGSHGACVLHDPVFVHIWGIVVAGGARRAQRRERRHRNVKSLVVCRFDGAYMHSVCPHRSKKNLYGCLSTCELSEHITATQSPFTVPKNTCLLLFTNYCSVTGATVVHSV